MTLAEASAVSDATAVSAGADASGAAIVTDSDSVADSNLGSVAFAFAPTMAGSLLAEISPKGREVVASLCLFFHSLNSPTAPAASATTTTAALMSRNRFDERDTGTFCEAR